MKKASHQFSHLRIYRNVSTPKILNAILCNRIMNVPILVQHASKIYNYSSRIFTPTVANYFITKTFGQVFTAGNSINDTFKLTEIYKKQNINVAIDYCAEGDITQKGDEVLLDENAALFAKSADQYSKFQGSMVSIKITALIKMMQLKTMNDAVIGINKYWSENSKDGYLDGQSAFSGLQKIYDGLSDEHFNQYLQVIHGYTGNPKQFKIDEVDFKMNHHPYYLYQPHKNSNFIIRLFFPLDQSQLRTFENMKQRISLICDKHANNDKNFRILVDAEQSYVQKAIQSISEQMQAHFNQNQLFMIPTIQNYLKSSVSRTRYEVEIAKRRNLYFGGKLVRGAYLVEETKISKEKGTEFPIVSCFEETTENYLQSFKSIVSAGFEKGEVFVASHNRNTIQETAKIAKQADLKIKLNYAQLLGLADHLTHKLQNDGYSVYKLLPWAQTKVMVPYMIRRAEQLSQMKYPLTDQYELLKCELKERYIG